MTIKRRKFTKEFKLQVLREIEAGASIAHTAWHHHLHPNVIHKWREQHDRYADRAFAGNGHAYTDLLTTHGIQISMSQRGNPYDNAQAESFMKTLRYEEVYVNDYETSEEARASIGHFLEVVYTQKRLHSALGYCPPTEFEAMFNQAPLV